MKTVIQPRIRNAVFTSRVIFKTKLFGLETNLEIISLRGSILKGLVPH